VKAFTKAIAWLAIVAALALVAAACGGSDDDDSSSSSDTKTTASTSAGETTPSGETGGNTLELEVDPGKLKFKEETLTAQAGDVTLVLTNTENIQHNIALKDSDGNVLEEGELVGDGETSEITVKGLEPGTYTYICTPHEAAGMTGTLTIT